MTELERKAYYDSLEFKENYLYEGTDLGAVWNDSQVTIKLWSPLADSVTVHFYENGEGEATASASMKRGEKGVWEYTKENNRTPFYYDFTLTIDGETHQSADPYAKAAGCNGKRSMALDLRATDPDGWEEDCPPETGNEQIIYEMHIKDFSFDPASGVPKEYRGKYKGFAVAGTTLEGKGEKPTGLDYLKELGVTHVQLMPVYDYGSVDESQPEGQYNWGYDPVNYNVPEGSYSTDPYHGEVRIRELKELIMTLHKQGIGVIMDVVYNHTYSLDSWFQKTVPGYYYRQNPDGSYSNGSDCGNDVACEREMCGKYILESVLYWVEDYHMDGFRFDLMGLMSVELLNLIRKELDARYGKGRIILYGEPWRAADSPMGNGHRPCLKGNMHLLDESIGCFCDSTRDLVKGHVFYAEVPGIVNGGTNMEKDVFSAVRAWVGCEGEIKVKAPSQIVTYISAHDNMTLWDKLMVTMKPEKSYLSHDEDVVRANKLAAGIYFTCQGRIFFLGGEEAARTKLGDDNSYASSSERNQIDWKRVYEYEDVLEYYKGLIAFRKEMPGLYDKSADAGKRIYMEKIPAEGMVQFCVNNKECSVWNTLCVCINTADQAQKLELPDGNWELLTDENSSFLWKNPKKADRIQEMTPVSIRIFGKIND